MGLKGTEVNVIIGADDQSPTFDAVVSFLRKQGFELEVLPTLDWPTVARKVGEAVASGASDMGIVMCWTGTGTSMMANKVPGVRAALCWEPWIAEGARRWNDANVLVMSLKRTPPQEAIDILQSWLSVQAPDSDEVSKIKKLADYEGGLAGLSAGGSTSVGGEPSAGAGSAAGSGSAAGPAGSFGGGGPDTEAPISDEPSASAEGSSSLPLNSR